jgi:glycosyltransferase involved in cell wall biosynthesis
VKLSYLTRVDISSKAAQASQIQSMGRAFHGELGDDFILITGALPNKDYPFPHKSVPFTKYPLLRYISACLVAAKRTLSKDEDAVFTRDIMVAAVVVALGGHAIYEAHKDPRGKLAHYLMKFLSKMDRFSLVSISQALSDYYGARYPIPDERQLVAHDGVFPEDYTELRKVSKNELRKGLGLPEDKIVIVHTGSLYKGGAELFGTLVDGRKDVIFIQVGGSPAECENWTRHYAQRGIYNIEFISHKAVDIVRKYQVSADLLFYVTTNKNPIYWCTSPLKLFEYMASGTPILASNIGSVSEIINNSNACIFNPDDEISINKSLNEYLSNQHDAIKKSNLALEHVCKNYSWSIRVEKILQNFKIDVRGN